MAVVDLAEVLGKSVLHSVNYTDNNIKRNIHGSAKVTRRSP